MRVLKLAFESGTAMPILALLFASGASLALVGWRVHWTHDPGYTGLAWNLFLAWLPLVFALIASEQNRRTPGQGWRVAVWVGVWILFFPNAPYIFTDLIHLTNRVQSLFWVDLVLILSCALTGFVLGFLSLYLIQGLVRERFGLVASWLLIPVVAVITGFGVYLGRFMRFNSWDILLRPRAILREIGNWATTPPSHSTGMVVPLLFAAFIFTTYLLLYGLTRLRRPFASNPPAGE